MKTVATDKLPEITWERGDFVDRPDDYVNVYCAIGDSEDGREWGGSWIECCDEVEIEDIECEYNPYDEDPEPNYGGDFDKPIQEQLIEAKKLK
jgi:hypothetical protein